MGDLASSEEATFQPLIAAKDSLFWTPFRSSPPEAHNFTHISAILNRGYLTKGAILETHGVGQDFPEIL